MPERNIRPGVARLFYLALRRRTNVESEADYEIQFHLEERTRQLEMQGLSAIDARLEAARRFGDMKSARDSYLTASTRTEHKAAMREKISDVLQDIRFALRSLRRSPSFVAIAIACLTLGIGANVAIFAVVDGVLLKPLPYRNPEQLVRVWSTGAVPAGVFEIVKRESKSYAGLEGAEGGRQVSLTDDRGPARIVVSNVTAGLFDLLGTKPLIGRSFDANENESSIARTALISHALWQSRFGGDSSIVGRTLRLDGIATTIVGVMPARFAFPSADVQLWTPSKFVRSSPAYWWSTYFTLIGRLKPGMTPARAGAEAALVFPIARAAFPMRMPDDWARTVDVAPLDDSMVKSARPTIVLLYAAVALVLLVACVNVAGLYLGRTLLREREIAVRTALGAGRARIARLLLTESLMVAVAGAVFGLAFAWFSVRALVSMLPADTPRVADIALGGRAVALTMMLTVSTALVFGLLPILRAGRAGGMSTLRSDVRSGSSKFAGKASYTLAVLQVSLAVTLVTGAGLLIKSLWQLQHTALGFNTANIVATAIPIPSFPNDTATRAPRFYEAVLEQARRMPGTESVAIASSLPFGDGITSAAMEVEAHPTPPGGVPALPQLSAVSADYFRVLGIPLVAGRLLTDADREGSLRVGLVDEVAARTLWPNGSAIGQRIRYVWSKDWITVVGVVGSVKRDSLSSAPAASLYLPVRQDFARPMRLIVKSSAGLEASASAMRDVVSGIDATVPIGEVRLLQTIVNGSAARERFVALLLSSFGAVALILGAVGIYGVVSASVARRTREIGVRMALGASKANVLRGVLEQSLAMSAVGVVLGIGGAVASVSLIRSMLVGVSVLDVSVLAGVVVLLAGVSVCAALAPALRASRVDPLTAIRGE